jgi:2-amino-4-hydroxy-6-hydroxymethyldihydropteridine diphosphokinase
VSDAVTCYIAVGSNIEPEANILRALDLLNEQVPIKSVSTFYRSEALDRPEQDFYLNGMVRGKAAVSARTLKFEVLRGVEAKLGRLRTADMYAARTIDLDVALYGMLVVKERDLTIPDPDIDKRSFLASPLLELAGDVPLPGCGRLLSEVAKSANAPALTVNTEFTRTLRERLCHEHIAN